MNGALQCPICETVNEDSTRCRQCSADLGPLARVIELQQQLIADQAQHQGISPMPAVQSHGLRWMKWAVPVVAFACGLLMTAILRSSTHPAPVQSASSRLSGRLGGLEATRDLHLAVTELNGKLQVSGPVPTSLQLGLVRDLAAEEAPGAIDSSGLSLVAAPVPMSYRVRKGDTLWLIARRKYGEGSLWPQVAAANNLSQNSSSLAPGNQLALPTLTLQPR
jgi:LysM repeat protein